MNNQSGAVKYGTLAALALSLTLTACAPTNGNATPTTTPTGTATHIKTEGVTVEPSVKASESPSATPTVTPSIESAPQPVTTPPASPEVIAPTPATPHTGIPASLQLSTFTFSDGHISFDYPSNWSVKTEQGLHLNETDKATSVQATVYDANGNDVAVIASGEYGGGTAGPAKLVVIDSEKMPKIPELYKGGNAEYAFIQYTYPFTDGPVTRYTMGLINENFVSEGEDGTSGSPYILLNNGAARAQVVFTKAPFKSLDTARAWTETDLYKNLKGVMTSIRYN